MLREQRGQEGLDPSSPRRGQPLPRRKLVVLVLTGFLLSMAFLAAHGWASQASWEEVGSTTHERTLRPGFEWTWSAS